MDITGAFKLTDKNNELRNNHLTNGYGNPTSDLFLIDHGITVNDINITGRIVFNIFGADGSSIGHVIIGYNEIPIYDITTSSIERYVLHNFDDFTSPLYVTHDVSVFLAVDAAGYQCAYIPGFKKTGRTTPFDVRVMRAGVSTLLQSSFMDVRVVVGASDIESANKSVNDTGATVYLYEDLPTPDDNPLYTQQIIKNLHDRTAEQIVDEHADVYDAWRLPLNTTDKIKNIIATMNDAESTRRQVAISAYTYAKHLSDRCPAFISMHDIRMTISVHRIHDTTVESIIRRISYTVQSRRKTALSAVRVDSWGKHNRIKVTTLEGVIPPKGVTIITAPTASGKTKEIIKPFAEKSKKTGTFLAVAPLVSLIRELSKKLGTDNYEDMKTRQHAIDSDAMSVCLPSIKSMVLRPFIDRADHIAIDEISQNIRFTASNNCSVKGASAEDVYFELKKIISEATYVVAADASIDAQTLRFFEQARPDEQFTVIDMLPVDRGRKCFIYESMSDLIDKIYRELASGGRVWIAVESADRAEVLNRVFSTQHNVLMINSQNKSRAQQKKFLADATNESLLYDVVIASPTISSGISIEHSGFGHFTLIAGIASGNRICPSDFMQMLARVRYVDDYHVCLLPNNIRDDRVTVKSILAGQRQAAALEGKSIKENEYSEFRAHTDVENTKYRADFANGFYWIMEHFKFTIERILDTHSTEEHKLTMKTVADDIKRHHAELLKSAAPIDEETAERYELNATTEQQSYQFEAYMIRKMLGYPLNHQLNDTDIEMRDQIRNMDRLNKYLGKVGTFDDSDKNIALRSFNHAQVVGYRLMFESARIENCEFSQGVCKPILDRVVENRFLLASLGLIPRKYAKWDENQRTGILKPYPTPTDAVKAVNQIIQYLGVSLKAKKKRVGSEIVRTYAINPEEWALISSYAERRFSAKNQE